MRHRVVITGMGAITALGQDLDTFWNNLVQGKSGVSAIDSFDVSEYPTRIAASVKDFNPEDYMDRKEARKMDRFVQFAAAAAKSALQDSGLNIGEQADPERVGVMIGSGIGGLGTWEDQHNILLEKRPEARESLFYSHDDCEYGFRSRLDFVRRQRAQHDDGDGVRYRNSFHRRFVQAHPAG